MRKQPTLVEHDAAAAGLVTPLSLPHRLVLCMPHTGGHHEAMGAARTMVGAAESGGGGGVGTNDQAALRRKEQTRAAENRRDPLGWDTNLTWLQTRSGMLDKRPALEYLVGIDRYTGAYIPELAEKWVMSPDGKDWTVTLRQGIPFTTIGGVQRQRRASCGFLISQPEAAASDTSIWRSVMGIGKADTVEEVARKVEQGVEIRNNYEVVFHLQQAVPEFLYMISANADLVMESKARWDAGGKEALRAEGGGHGSLRVRRAQGGLARAVQTG